MEDEQFWIPLVDEPIGDLVARLEAEDEEIRRLISSPARLLAFRTFAYIRAGLVLGQLLVENDVKPEADRTWVEQLVADPKHLAAVADEVRAVARDVAADPKLAAEVGPDDEARERFLRFARGSLKANSA